MIKDIQYSKITPFKGRDIDLEKKVEVYRCLHKKGRVYSIRQSGLVVAHTTHIALHGCKFIIQKAGQARTKRDGQRNVHAFIRGRVCTRGTMGAAPTDNRGLPMNITYNPFEDDFFMTRGDKISGASGLIINDVGVTAAYTH